MHERFDRRTFLAGTGLSALGLGLLGPGAARLFAGADDKQKGYEISLAQWSLRKALFGGELDNLDFAPYAKQQFDIDAVEYVNQFFKNKATDEKYLARMKKSADNSGVRSVLIMCDGEGQLGHPDKNKRDQAVKNHHKWVDAAKYLGCHSIRVNAHSRGSRDEQRKLAADGLRQLCEYAEPHKINVIVENHGGLSSNGQWLSSVMKTVDHPRVGTLPDFGNFGSYNRYKGVKELMPWAKGVSAKTHAFNDKGEETGIDYRRMMKIVLDAGYHGYVGIEYSGGKHAPDEGIRLTKTLLERLRRELTA
jgi:sugar phosphate isomerase/epimerase